MDLSREELEAAKAYMRVDGTEDDVVVATCLSAARAYLSGAGVSLPAPGTPRRASYDLVCHSLALSLYDRRDLTAENAVGENPMMRAMLHQLKFTEPMSNLDTGKNGG